MAAEPHVAIVELCDDDEFLVIGSDGLYEVFGNHKQLVKVVKDTLRATGSVDETVKTIIRGTCCMMRADGTHQRTDPRYWVVAVLCSECTIATLVPPLLETACSIYPIFLLSGSVSGCARVR